MLLPGVNVQKCIIFLAHKAQEEDDKSEEKLAKAVPKTVDDMVTLLVRERESLGSGDMNLSPDQEDEKPVRVQDLTLDSELDLRKEEEEWKPRQLWRKDPYAELEGYLPSDVTPPRVKVVRQYDLSEDDCSSHSDEARRKSWKIPSRLAHPDVNMYSKDYWLARKKVKNLRVGNDMAIVNTLNLMTKMEFSKYEDLLYGIVDSGGLETILNILDFKGENAKLNGLKLLNKMADNEIVKGLMVNQGIPDSCFQLLSHRNVGIVLEASEILLKLCALKCMRAYCRKSKGLEILLEFAANTKTDGKDSGRSELQKVSVNCLLALDLLFPSRAVRLALYRLGFLSLLKQLIASRNQEFYTMGIRFITQAASVNEYLEVFIEEGLMEFVYKKYTSKEPSIHLDMLRVVYKCLENVKCKHWMLQRGLFEFLMEEFRSRTTKELKYTMGCIVKFANIEKYRRILNYNKPIGKLFVLFDHPTAKIRDHAGYLMGQLSKYPKNFPEIAGVNNLGVMKMLDYVQTNTDYTLVAHIYKVICDLSFDDGIYWDICDVTDPIGILWGAVTADHPKIHEYGCSALVPYIGPMPNSIERVLRFPGAIHDLLNLTQHPDDGAKAGAVTLLARLCQSGLLFGTLIEEGFDTRLLDLAKNATHPRLRYAIGYGLGSCARTSRMSFSLGKRGAVAVLLDWLVNDSDGYAQLGIVTGLWKLSFEPINCKTIIEAKVSQRLTYLSAGKRECLQNSLAGLLSNMRYLARSAESLRNKQRTHPPEPNRGLASDPDIIHPFQYADDPDDTPLVS